MLVRSGDLIPVHPVAAQIPWTRRKALILNFLKRGPVDFETYVYDTNVGDVAMLSTYFNPNLWTNEDLNEKFATKLEDASTDSPNLKSNALSKSSSSEDIGNLKDDEITPSDSKDSSDEVSSVAKKMSSLVPKLLVYPLKETPSTSGDMFQNAFVHDTDPSLFDAPPPNIPMPPPNMTYTLPPPNMLENASKAQVPKAMMPMMTESQLIPSIEMNHSTFSTESLVELSQSFSNDETFHELTNLCHPLNEESMSRAVAFGDDVNSNTIDWSYHNQSFTSPWTMAHDLLNGLSVINTTTIYNSYHVWSNCNNLMS